MKILVTGGAGYLGSVLIPQLLLRGHEVRVLDIGYFGLAHIQNLKPSPEIIREDIREVLSNPFKVAKTLEGIDAIVHLAALSNDPSAELDPQLTHELNCETTIKLARLAKQKKIKFLFSSTCSVYGASDEFKDEKSTTNPLTTYALSKREAEAELLKLKDAEWNPTIFRFGTLYGFSPRMRFDLVVNIFSLFSFMHREIKIFGTGEFFRPFVHVRDAARAINYFLERTTPSSLINISNENLSVNEVAQIFKRVVPNLKLNYFTENTEDKRNYKVNNSLMKEEGFKPFSTVEFGSQEIQEQLIQGKISDPESLYYQNVKWLKELGLRSNPLSVSFKKTG